MRLSLVCLWMQPLFSAANITQHSLGQLFLSVCSVIYSKLESGGACWSPWVWQQSASHLMDHETHDAVLVLLIHMGFWDITQVLYNNSSELSTMDYNLKHWSSLNKSCLYEFVKSFALWKLEFLDVLFLLLSLIEIWWHSAEFPLLNCYGHLTWQLGKMCVLSEKAVSH